MCDTSWLSDKTNKAADNQQIFISFGYLICKWLDDTVRFSTFGCFFSPEGKMKHDLRSLDLARPFWNGDV